MKVLGKIVVSVFMVLFLAAYHNRGVAYYEKGQVDRAFADYNKAVKIDPEYPWTYINRGLAYRKTVWKGAY